MLDLTINGVAHHVDAPDDMPLLWVIRDLVGLTGTKYGCGIGQCGACTVHVDGTAVRSCMVRASAVAAKRITTIEGLAVNGDHPLQQAWIAESVPQCGYCQPGQIMNAAAGADGADAMAGNICICGCYGRIRSALARAGAS